MAKRILVVDDDMMCLKTVQRYLTEAGFEVLGALSGMQAIHITEETKIDLLLLDIEMPGLSGFAVLEQIREMPDCKQLPVIFFTGRKDRDTVKRCAAVGAEGYIMKPVEKSVLLNRVEEVYSKLAIHQEEKTVLIIDDDIELLKDWKLCLRKNYKVIVISTGKSAIDYMTTHTVDLIVLDDAMLLDEKAGITFIRQTDHLKEKPVILLCREDVDKVKERYQETPASAYLRKPVNAEVLQQTIQHQFSLDNVN